MGWSSPPEVFRIAIVQIFAMLSSLRSIRQKPCTRTNLSLYPSWPLLVRKHFKRHDNLKEVFFFHKNLTSIIKQASAVHHNQELSKTTKLPQKRANLGIINQFHGTSLPAIYRHLVAWKSITILPTIGCQSCLWRSIFQRKVLKITNICLIANKWVSKGIFWMSFHRLTWMWVDILNCWFTMSTLGVLSKMDVTYNSVVEETSMTNKRSKFKIEDNRLPYGVLNIK